MTTPEEEAEEGKGKAISSDLIRGHINTIILRALYDGDKYGYAIKEEIERKSHGQYSIKEPSLYSALKRLEKEGYITSYWGGSVSGGRRKYFSLTEEGKEISETNQAEWEYSRTVIDSLISDKDFDFANPAPTAVNMRMLRSTTSRVPSREGEAEDLDYEPIFDDSAERTRLAAEYEEQVAQLENERLTFEEEKQRFEEEKAAQLESERLAFEEEKQRFEEEKVAQLESERLAFEEEKQRFEEEKVAQLENERLAFEEEKQRFEEEKVAQLESERLAFEEEKQRFEEEKVARLENERLALDENKQRFEDEIRARNSAYQTECDWREKEIAERERLLEEKRKEIEAIHAENMIAAERSAAIDEAAHAAEASAFAERVRLFEEEESARKQALEDEESMRMQALEEEESARKQALEDEELAKRLALEAEESERRRILDEEEIARRQALDEEEAQRRLLLDEEIARKQELTAQAEEQLLNREQELQEREAYFMAEHARLNAMLRQRDELIEAERRAHAEELELREKRIIEEQEAIFRQREQQLIHKNYRDLVNTPPPTAPKNDDYGYYATPIAEASAEEPAYEAPRDYRPVIHQIFSATHPSRETYEGAGARSLNGVNFGDLEEKAAQDGIRITTAGGKPATQKQEDYVNTVHKGKALFFSSIVVLCLCFIEGCVIFGIREQYAIPLFHPYFIWCAGLALTLVTWIASINHFGERAIRKRAPVLETAIIIYILCVIITLIVALGVNIDFTSASALATYVVVPIVFFFGIVVFGICYYFLTRPKKD
ncbi:MAG: helix-turn-helix transcriptional regulator [Clostridia bacterium]|nr:helix-turn-helix transcriptional regulator [Clostridia bacterium]